MTVDVRPNVVVRRSPADVAAFMFDPGNDLRNIAADLHRLRGCLEAT